MSGPDEHLANLVQAAVSRLPCENLGVSLGSLDYVIAELAWLLTGCPNPLAAEVAGLAASAYKHVRQGLHETHQVGMAAKLLIPTLTVRPTSPLVRIPAPLADARESFDD